MRKFILMLLFFSAFNADAFDQYEDNVSYSVTHLGFTNPQLMQAVKFSFSTRGWQAEDETENSVIGNLKGTGQSKVKVEVTGDTIKVSYLTRHDMASYKFYKRLLNIKSTMMVFLTDCTNKELAGPANSIDKEMLTRRNLMYAFYKYNWRISELSRTRIVATLPAKGRIEVEYDASGLLKIRRWDEIAGEYTNPDRDGYVRRIKTVFKRQQSVCLR